MVSVVGMPFTYHLVINAVRRSCTQTRARPQGAAQGLDRLRVPIGVPLDVAKARAAHSPGPWRPAPRSYLLIGRAVWPLAPCAIRQARQR